MKYKIVRDGKVIAAFLYVGDRDCCIEALRDFYNDCVFEAKDN